MYGWACCECHRPRAARCYSRSPARRVPPPPPPPSPPARCDDATAHLLSATHPPHNAPALPSAACSVEALSLGVSSCVTPIANLQCGAEWAVDKRDRNRLPAFVSATTRPDNDIIFICLGRLNHLGPKGCVNHADYPTKTARALFFMPGLRRLRRCVLEKRWGQAGRRSMIHSRRDVRTDRSSPQERRNSNGRAAARPRFAASDAPPTPLHQLSLT
jgi:hypothetical protein